MSQCPRLDRRGFLSSSLAAAGAAGAILGAETPGSVRAGEEPAKTPEPKPAADAHGMPCGMLGKAKISRLMLGGNLVTGCMHARDLHYVTRLFRAYVTEEKMMETFKVAEEHGVNTVFESGADFVQRNNQKFNGHMQFIPSIHPDVGLDEQRLKDEIKHFVNAGAAALYTWGVVSDKLVKIGAVDVLARAVELAKASGLAVGVGGHSLQVPMACEKAKVPCDFYVKTLHRDDYPSAVPPELRKDFIWLEGGKGFYDNMWCIHPQEVIDFMATVTKPWIAFKVLAAGAILPRQGFPHAFGGGADFIAVGMFDFQIKENCELVRKVVDREQRRSRPWRA